MIWVKIEYLRGILKIIIQVYVNVLKYMMTRNSHLWHGHVLDKVSL